MEQKVDHRRYVSGSRVAALFNLHPYLSRWMLWQYHANGVKPEFEDNERMLWGRLLEPVIVAETGKRLNFETRRAEDPIYVTDPSGAPLGCKVDAHILCPTRGRGVVSAKNIDWKVWADQWSSGDMIPKQYGLQLQCEMACQEVKWGVLSVLVGGNELHLFEQERVEEVIDLMRENAGAFLETVDAKDEPELEGIAAEIPILDKLWPEVAEEGFLDLRGNGKEGDFDDLCAQYTEAAEARRARKKSEDGAKAKLLRIVEDNRETLSDLWRCKLSKGKGTRLTVKER